MNAFQKYRTAFTKAFRKNKVAKAYLFGSTVSGSQTDQSDIDLLIEFEADLTPLEQGELWWSLYDTLREVTNKDIDLLTPASLKNPYFIESIEKSKKLVYGA